jgi:hypothetical protein
MSERSVAVDLDGQVDQQPGALASGAVDGEGAAQRLADNLVRNDQQPRSEASPDAPRAASVLLQPAPL